MTKWKLSKRQARKVRKRGIATARQRRSKERRGFKHTKHRGAREASALHQTTGHRFRRHDRGKERRLRAEQRRAKTAVAMSP